MPLPPLARFKKAPERASVWLLGAKLDCVNAG
jgi:hypothetical protein